MLVSRSIVPASHLRESGVELVYRAGPDSAVLMVIFAAFRTCPACQHMKSISRVDCSGRDGVGAALWRFTRTNGMTEGFHNKMELISRQAYGFRNFENYRIRVKVLCA